MRWGGGVRGAFLKCESEYMGRFCNTTQPAVFSSLCSPTPPVPPPHPVLPPISHQAPSLFLLSLSFSHPVPPHPLSTLSLFPLFPGALFIWLNPSGCLPWPSVLLSFNVGPMGTGVHSKTGRAWEQETGSRAGGERPAVTSVPRLPHLD